MTIINTNNQPKLIKQDIKKKPTPELLIKIAKSSKDKKHPFHKTKLKKKEKIENIFLKKKS